MRTVILPLLLASAGCVTQGTYDTLQSTYDALKTQNDQTVAALAQREKDLGETRLALKREEAKAQDLAGKMAQLEGALGDTQKDKSALENALADLKKRKAETAPLMLGGCTPLRVWCSWKRRSSSAVAVSGDRPMKAANARTWRT